MRHSVRMNGGQLREPVLVGEPEGVERQGALGNGRPGRGLHLGRRFGVVGFGALLGLEPARSIRMSMNFGIMEA